MATGPSLALRFSELDKAALVELAARLDLNQTQTVRVLVRETLTVLKEREAQGTDEERQSQQPPKEVSIN